MLILNSILILIMIVTATVTTTKTVTLLKELFNVNSSYDDNRVNDQKGMQVRARFVERFSMGAPFSAGEVQGPPFADVSHKVDWVEKFVRVGTAATEAARSQEDQ